GGCLTLLGVPSNGTNIGTRPCNGSNTQKWYLEPFGSLGSFRIRSIRDIGKCIDVAQWSKNNGDNIHLWSCHTALSQQWYAEPMSNGYRFHLGLNYNQCMDLAQWTLYDNVHTWTCHG